MGNSLEELKQKQRKLLYHLGEVLHRFYLAGDMDFVFPAKNTEQEKELSKLLKLLDYMAARVRKFEEVVSRENALDTGGETVPATACVTEEKPGEGPAENVFEKESAVVEEKTACAPAAASETKEALQWEESGPVAAEEAPLTVRTASLDDAVAEPVNEGPSSLAFSEGLENQTSAVLEAPKGQGTPEPPAQVPEDPALQETVSLTFQGLFDRVQFKSETERRLFEDNLGVLQNGDEPERVKALRSLSHFGGKRALKDVCRLVLKDPGPAVRIAALKIISRTRDAESADLYRAGLLDEDAGVRIASIKGLSTLFLKDCVSSIEPMLRDPDARVRGMTVTYLGIYGGLQGVQVASGAWKDPEAYVRKSLVDVLAIVRAPGTVPVIKQLLDDPDEGVQRSAANALSKTKAAETKG